MKKSISLFLLAVLLVSGCSAGRTRSARSATVTPSALSPVLTSTPVLPPSPTQKPTEEPTITPTATAAPFMVTLAQDTTCRLGPGENYYKMVLELKGDMVELNGRNEDSTWVIIKENSSDSESPSCWIPVSSFVSLSKLDGLSAAEYEALPFGPSSITAPNGVCGANRPMIVEWSPVENGTEYRLYRNGKAISTQTGGKYYDPDMPNTHKTTAYTYMVQAFNDYGTSPAIAVSVTVCGK